MNILLTTQHCYFLGTKNIMITIVRPVVRSTSEVTIAEVLEDRFIHELKDENNAKTRAEELAKRYRGAELPRCRLKATQPAREVEVSSLRSCSGAKSLRKSCRLDWNIPATSSLA